MKYLKKTLSFVLSFAMAFTMVIVPRGSVSAADAATESVTYFPVNMYNYTTDSFNSATKALESDSDGTQGIYFNTGDTTTTINKTSVTNKNYNTWTGKWDANGNGNTYKDTSDRYYPCLGLVENTLKDGKDIQFTKPQAGIFTNDTSNGSKEYFTNVGMPFKTDSDGYYYFDSSKYDVYFENGKGASDTQLKYSSDGSKTTVKSNSESGRGNIQGFFPFNKYNVSRYNYEDAVYHFGMNMGVQFYIPPTADNETGPKINNKDITFSFTGDDDVWVFVDGKLVLDLGGIHDAISGDINFTTGKVTTYRGTNTGSDVADPSTVDNTYLQSDEWKQMNEDGEVHSLQVFYLERGKSVSNCKIKFNLPQKDKLEVIKTLGNTNATDDDLAGGLADQKFQFVLEKLVNNSYEPCKSAKYTLFQDNSIIKRNNRTSSSDGTFSLKFNQKAVFLNLDKNTSYRVVEKGGSNYTTTWKTYKNNENPTTSTTTGVSGGTTNALEVNTKEKVNNYTFEFTNTFNSTLVDDVVVIDYGKQIAIDVLANDISFGDTKELTGIRKTSSDKFGTDALKLENGEATIQDGKIVYRPFQYMSSIDRLQYSAKIKDANYDGDKAGNVSIIPATTVYYEDNFGGKGDGTENGLAIKYEGDWYTVKDDTTINQKKDSLSADLSNGTKGTSANTDAGIQNDGTVGKGQIYGYDSTYEGNGKFSGGSSAVVNGTYDKTSGTYSAKATFKFTGTGFDIISRTDKNCGGIHVVVRDEKGNLVIKDNNGKFIVNTDEKINASKRNTISVENQGTNTLYQIPVISVTGLPHNKYTVTIMVTGESPALKTGATFYLDAIRIYNPIKSSTTTEDKSNGKNDIGESGNEAGGSIITKAEDAYSEDNENDTITTLVKSIIVNGKTIKGSAFIDTLATGGSGSTSDSPTYENLGPNNEVYLSEGEGITFTMNMGREKPKAVYIGAKSPNGKASTLSVGTVSNTTTDGKEQTKELGYRKITSATDMYYDITKYIDFKYDKEKKEYTATIVIGNKETTADKNATKSLLSLTNIKYLYSDKIDEQSEPTTTVNEDNTAAAALAKTMLRMPEATEPEPTPEPEKANLEITSAKFNSSKVSILKSATLTVKTSDDVKYLGILDSDGKVIEPSSITSKVDKSLVGTENDSVAKTWTVKIKFNKLGTNKIAVYGIGETGKASNQVKEVSIKVNLLGSIKDLFKQW